MTREEALTMIIASIAMEELALSHILNAEGEKLQYVLGTLPGAGSCACPQEVLAVNKSVTALVEAVTQNQMLLKNKLDRALEFCPLPPPPCKPGPGPAPCPCEAPCSPPCPPPCPARPCQKSALQLASQREKVLWSPNCRLLWSQRSLSGGDICWDERAPSQIQLSPGKSYTVLYTLNVCAASPMEGKILLRQSPCGAFTDALPLCFSIGRPPRGVETLYCAAVLHPCGNGGCGVSLSLMLEAKAALCVERAAMDVIEL